MKLDELKRLSDKELQDRVTELSDELFRLRLQKSKGELERSHFFRAYKKEIARSLTLLTARQSSATA